MFDMLNRSILRRAKTIIALDDAMAKRFGSKMPVQQRRTIEVVPPWPAQESDSPIAHEDNAFRIKHQLAHKRLIMHSGNHSAVHPLSTLLDAIEGHSLPNLYYAFVGGGVGKLAIEQWVAAVNPANVLLLPYQPREMVHVLLSAADVHVISVGNDTVGIVHPSKTYGALAAGRPLLVIGPGDSPAARLVREHKIGWHVEHGDVQGARRCLSEINEISEDELTALQSRAFELGRRHFSRRSGIDAVCANILGNRTTKRR
jgi:colanic acid biosynthesis glycosyl transferase WcaI